MEGSERTDHPPQPSNALNAGSVSREILVVTGVHEKAPAFSDQFLNLTSLRGANQAIQDHRFLVAVVSLSFSELSEFLINLRLSCPSTRLILVGRPSSVETLIEYQRLCPICRVSQDWSEALGPHLLQALELSRSEEQNLDLLNLVEQQVEKERQLSLQLESRVTERQQEIETKRKQLQESLARLQGVQNALLRIFKAQSISEIETHLSTSLKESFQVVNTQIRYSAQMDGLTKTHPSQVFISPLVRDQMAVGQVMFVKEGGSFLRDEKRRLEQLAHSLNLVILRLEKWSELERVRYGWEVTFDAILEPVGIVDANYRLQHVNQSYAQFANKPIDNLQGRKCHEVLFGLSSPCPQCRLGGGFRLTNLEKEYDVSSQQLEPDLSRSSDPETPMFLNLYRDITNRLIDEQRLLETAKLAELGTVSSSIAHELNNPLGGMLTYVQLMQSELKKAGPEGQDLLSDLNDIETSIRRCSEIVKSLLIYVRQESEKDSGPFDVRDTIHQALNILSVQSRSSGIKIEFQDTTNPKEPLLVLGNFQILTQALSLLLQQSHAGHMRRKASHQTIQTNATFLVRATDSDIFLQLQDSGIYSERESESAAPSSLVLQLLREAEGTIEIRNASPVGRELEIRLARFRSQP